MRSAVFILAFLLTTCTTVEPVHDPLQTSLEETCAELSSALDQCMTGCKEFESSATCIYDLCIPLVCEARARVCPLVPRAPPPSRDPVPRPFDVNR